MNKNIFFSALLLIMFSPYLKYGFRIDQLLIPLLSVILLILHKKINKKFSYVLFFILIMNFVLPLLSTLINLNSKELYTIDFFNFIKETQNILKPFFYILFGYFGASYLRFTKKSMYKSFKLVIIGVFILSSLNVFFSFIYGPYNFYNLFLVKYYKLHPYAAANIRYPGILGIPYNAGLWFIFFLFIAIYYDYDKIYKIFIFLVGFFANTKVFYLSLPFILMEYFYKYKIDNKYTIKKRKIFMNFIGFIFILFIIVIISVSLVKINLIYFNTLLTRSLIIIKNNPLAGREDNIVAKNIAYILEKHFWFGVGFLKTPYTRFSYGLWDSGFNYMLNFGGIFCLIFQTAIYVYIFVFLFNKDKYKTIAYLFFINWFLINFGTLAFYAERISDLIFIYLGLEYSYSRRDYKCPEKLQ